MAILDQNQLPSTLVPQQGQTSPFSSVGSPLPQGLTPEQEEALKRYMMKPSPLLSHGQRVGSLPPPGSLPASHVDTTHTLYRRPVLKRGTEAEVKEQHSKDALLTPTHSEEPLGTMQFPDGNSIVVTQKNAKEVYALARRAYPQMFNDEVSLPGGTDKLRAEVKAHPEKFKGLQFKSDFEKERPGADRPGGGVGGQAWEGAKGLVTGIGGMLKNAGEMFAAGQPTVGAGGRVGISPLPTGVANQVEQEMEAQDTRLAEGRSLPYRTVAPLANLTPFSAIASEESARRGDPGGVVGGALVGIGATLAPSGLKKTGEVAKPLATKGIDAFADVAAERASKLRADLEARAEASPKAARTLPDVLDGLIKGARRRIAPAATAATAHALGLPKLATATTAVWGTVETINGLLKSTPGTKMRLAIYDAVKDWHTELPPPTEIPLTPQQQAVVEATRTQKESRPEYTVSNATEQRLRAAQEKGNQPFTPREKPPSEVPPTSGGGTSTPAATSATESPTSSKGVTIKSPTTTESPTTPESKRYEHPSNPDDAFMRQDSLNRAHEILNDTNSSPESKKWSVNVLRDEVDRLGKEANNPKLTNKEFVDIIQQITDLETRLGKSMGKVVSEPIKSPAQLSQEKFTADLKKVLKLADFGIKGDQIPPDLEKMIDDQIVSMQKKGTFVGTADLLRQVQSKWMYREALGGVEPFEERLKAAKSTKDPLERTTAINNALNFEKSMLETRFGDDAGQIARAALEKSKLDPMHQLAVIRKWIKEGSTGTGLRTRGSRPEGPKKPGSGPGAMRARPTEGPATAADVAEFQDLQAKVRRNRVSQMTNEERRRFGDLYIKIHGNKPPMVTDTEMQHLFPGGESPLPRGGK